MEKQEETVETKAIAGNIVSDGVAPLPQPTPMVPALTPVDTAEPIDNRLVVADLFKAVDDVPTKQVEDPCDDKDMKEYDAARPDPPATAADRTEEAEIDEYNEFLAYKAKQESDALLGLSDDLTGFQFGATAAEPIQEPQQQLPTPNTCLTPDCDYKVRARGLCSSCYNAARLRVNSIQDVTWASLASIGLALISKKEATLGDGTAFTKAYNEAMALQAERSEADMTKESGYRLATQQAPARVVENHCTMEDFRMAAETFSKNPSQENLRKMVEVEGKIKTNLSPPPPEVPIDSNLPQDPPPALATATESFTSFLPKPTGERPPLPDNMTWCDEQAGEPGAGDIPRMKTRGELLIDERNRDIKKRSMLRTKSLGDSLVDSNVPMTVDEGDIENTNMSDEEFSRIRDSFLIRTGQIAPPPLPIRKVRLTEKPTPRFQEPSLPGDVRYDASLDG